jgi:hypothetical protein
MRNGHVPLGSVDQQVATAVLVSMGGFVAQVAALWELADICEESVRPRDAHGVEDMLREATEGSMAGLGTDVRLRVAQAGAEWIEAMQALPQDDFGVAFGMPHGTAEASVATERAQTGLEGLLSAYPDIAHAGTFVLGFLDALTAVSRVDVMYESIVTAAVSAFHAQLRAILLAVEHDRQPELDEAALSSIVDGLINGGGPKWRHWLHAVLGAGYTGEPEEVTLVSEVFARRNVFVHHGGVVSARYARAVPGAPRLGTRLTADATYTRQALGALVLMGVKVAVLAWSAFRPTFASSAQLLAMFLTQRYLLRVRAWPAVHDVAAWLLETAIEPSQRDFARVIAALSAKRMGNGAEVRSLCESLDVTQPDMALAREVLLDHLDEAFVIARRLLEAGALTTYDLDTWPVLDEMRADPRWGQLRPPDREADQPDAEASPA